MANTVMAPVGVEPDQPLTTPHNGPGGICTFWDRVGSAGGRDTPLRAPTSDRGSTAFSFY